jgi:hypothetical protein
MGLFDFLRPKRQRALYTGGDGTSVETAVVINAPNTSFGVHAEYQYITSKHGPKGTGWTLESQALMARDGKHFDVLKIKIGTEELRTYFFDITEFWGKF